MKEKTHFVVTYRNPEILSDPKADKNITLKVEEISDSTLGLGFICLRKFIFEKQGPIIDPKQDQLQQKFSKTKSLHLSIHQIVSIEEVGEDHKGLSFQKDKSNLLILNPEQSH